MYLVYYDNIKFKTFNDVDSLINNLIDNLIENKDEIIKHIYNKEYVYNRIIIGNIDNIVILFRNYENEKLNENEIKKLNFELCKILHNQLYLRTYII